MWSFLIHKMKKPIVNSCHTNENMFDMMLWKVKGVILISNVKNPMVSWGHGHAKPSIQWKFDKKNGGTFIFVCWDICFVDSSIMHDECKSNLF
jgi:hypothetical protein